jgi:twitching motility protein PilT
VTIHDLFGAMLSKRASHMHLVPGSPIMLRSAGQLSPLDSRIVSPTDTAALAESFLTEEQRYYFAENKDLSISLSVPGMSRFRIHLLQQRGSVALVLATHPPTPPGVDELGLPDVIKNIANLKQGLVVLCGGRGGGKSSTLAALINAILEARNCHILSVENPIDYLHRNKKGFIVQREIGSDTLSYTTAFESLAHQQPDVLYTTEIETYEVASTLINLATSGTLCIATTRDASATGFLEHFSNLFPAHLHQASRNLLATGLTLISAQFLLQKASGTGLVPAFEVLVNTPQVASLVREGKFNQIQSVMSTGSRDHGMQTQEQALRALVKRNIVTLDEANSKAVRPEDFKKMMALPY